MKRRLVRKIIEKRHAENEHVQTIAEEETKKYKFVYLWYDDPEDPDDPEKTANDFIEEGKKLGLTGFKVDVQGAYSDLENGVRYIYDGMAEKERKFNS